MILVFLLIPKSMLANFNITKSNPAIQLKLVNSDELCYLFIVESGFDQATHFTSVEQEQNFYNYKYHIKIPFYLKIEKDLCEELVRMKLMNNSITPFSFSKKLRLEKAETVQVGYNNNFDFSFREENKQYEITSSKEEAAILSETEKNAMCNFTYKLGPFDLIIKISDQKTNFKVDDVYMRVVFLFCSAKITSVSSKCFSRIVFSNENFFDVREIFVLPFSEEENARLKQQTNPKQFLKTLKKMKKSRETELFN